MATRRGATRGQLRIIGGTWRGRKLAFDPAPGLRPTPDRVRETLFNWLAPEIHGSRCLDLFCGSGALGLEALSRGAAHCTFVDSNPAAIAGIRAALETLQCEAATCAQADALRWVSGPGPAVTPFDIVFLDPPFGQNLLSPACRGLEDNHRLAPGALIYLEAAVRDGEPDVPENWQLKRDKQTGEVRYRLFVRPA